MASTVLTANGEGVLMGSAVSKPLKRLLQTRGFVVTTSVVLLPALILLFFHRLAFTNLILARGDTFLYFYPYWEAAAEALRAGRIPLWNPHLFMGAPFLANSQVGFFYPLNWPFWLILPAPYAVSGSILLHLLIAAVGTFGLGRRSLSLSRLAALLAALLFALGGYLTAQVEHVNQLQGLAWLPWLLLIGDWRLEIRDTRLGQGRVLTARVRQGVLLGVVFALQLTAGHTQTVFISGVALVLWLVVCQVASIRWKQASGQKAPEHGPSPAPTHDAYSPLSTLSSPLSTLLPLGLGVLLALLLAAVQLLPTVELAQHSARAGGLPPNEVLSFSLHPLLLGQSLLPAYGQTLFSEYVAFLPLTGLLLAVIGAWQVRRDGTVRPVVLSALVLAIGGLFLALGRFNLLYLLLARLPGFNLFRAPARWLVLYGLGMGLLAGVGWDEIRDWLRSQLAIEDRGAGIGEQAGLGRPVVAGVGVILLLVAWRLVAVPLATVVPVGAEVVVEHPSLATVVGWLVEGVLALFLFWWFGSKRLPRLQPLLSPALFVLAVIALFFGSRALPYNQLTTPAAYFSLRPPIARLQALADCDLLPEMCEQPPGRLLSLSEIFFDPGDLEEITTIYEDQLSPDALYDYLIAVKHKEVLSPNLPLAYGLFSVDGFDGGILPLRDYTLLTSVMLPAGAKSTDGRLREYLDAVPQARWLDLFNARYLITDKVGDEWRHVGEQSAFFDLQHPRRLAPNESLPVAYLPGYQATALWLVAEGEPGQVAVEAADGAVWELEPQALADNLWQVTFPEPAFPVTVRLQAGASPWLVRGLSLIDERDHTFQPLVPGNYRLIYSGDVKIYENLDVLPRAFVVDGWTWQPDIASAVAALEAPAFDPAHAAVLVGEGQTFGQDPVSAEATVVAYEPERVVVQAELAADGLLVLTDAYYPGWEVTVDGVPAELYQANGLFRGVMVPAGVHEVVFSFASRSYQSGLMVSAAALLLILAILFVPFRRLRL